MTDKDCQLLENATLVSLLVRSLRSRLTPFKSVVARLGSCTSPVVVIAATSALAPVKSAPLAIKIAIALAAIVGVSARWGSQGLLEVLVLQVHALLHVKHTLHGGFKTGHDGGVRGRPMPQTDRVRTILR